MLLGCGGDVLSAVDVAEGNWHQRRWEAQRMLA